MTLFRLRTGHNHLNYHLYSDPHYLLNRQEQITVFRLRTGHNHFNYHLYSDPHYLLNRREQVTVFRLRTGNNRLIYHLYSDPYCLLTRREQVTVFRLRTGHNRLNHHLYSKYRIGHTEQCPCGTGSQTTEHLLQSCPIYEPLRELEGIWPDHTPVARKLYGSLRDLRFIATFIEETGVSMWRTRRRRRFNENVSLFS